jgi:hypothetical protein
MVDLQKFVELANKYAPELWLTLGKNNKTVWLGKSGWHYDPGFTPPENGLFTLTLLEYLKGQRKNIKPIRLMMQTYTRSENVLMAWMDKRWLDITPEAVIQACIDVWEAME